MSLFAKIVAELPAYTPPERGTNTQNLAESIDFTSYKLDQLGTISHAMMENRSVNLSKCRGTVAAARDIKLPSAYQYLCRFFKTGKCAELNALMLGIIVRTLGKMEGAYYAIDRTEWQHGQRWYNFLVLGIVVNNVLIPLVVCDLGERKSSSTAERIAFWQTFEFYIKWLNDGEMPPVSLCGDREFGTSEWLEFLLERQVQFVFRAKSNQKWDIWHECTYRNKPVKLKTLVRYSRMTGVTKFELITKGSNQIIYLYIKHLAVSKPGQESFLCLLSNLESCEEAQQFYKTRWKIESCFKNLKTNGFGLEDCNIAGIAQAEMLFMLLAMIYALLIVEGIYQDHVTQTKILLMAKNSLYPKYSLFNFALQYAKITMASFSDFINRLFFFITLKSSFLFDFQLVMY
jgi:Transposase DDE domain